MTNAIILSTLHKSPGGQHPCGAGHLWSSRLNIKFDINKDYLRLRDQKNKIKFDNWFLGDKSKDFVGPFSKIALLTWYPNPSSSQVGYSGPWSPLVYFVLNFIEATPKAKTIMFLPHLVFGEYKLQPQNHHG